MYIVFVLIFCVFASIAFAVSAYVGMAKFASHPTTAQKRADLLRAGFEIMSLLVSGIVQIVMTMNYMIYY